MFLFFLATCIYFNTFPAHGDTSIASHTNSSIYRLRGETRSKQCTTSQYKCKNNQCVSSTVVCDGVRNCFDGSDETWEACERRYPNSCLLPEIPQEINYNVNCESSTAVKIFSSSKGNFVQELTLLSSTCNSNATHNGRLQSVCLKGKWTPQLSSCIKTCDSVPKVNNAKIKCYVNNEEVDCTGNHSPGTVIRPQCNADLDPNVEEAVCDESGQWHVDEFICGGCGVGIQATPPFQYPWTVAIYLKEFLVLVCAGTIVSTNTVVTAAACFDEEVVKMPTNYVIVVGKKKRDFHSIDSKYQKNYAIRKIHIPDNYQADSSANDIAIIELKDSIAYNSAVYAACVDWDNTQQIMVNPNITIGHVANYIVNEALGTSNQTNFFYTNLGAYFESNLDLYYAYENFESFKTKTDNFKNLKVQPGEDKFYVRRQGTDSIIITDKGTGYFIEYRDKYYLMGTASGMISPGNRVLPFTDVLKHSAWASPIINAAKSLPTPRVAKPTVIERTVETFDEDEVFTHNSLRIACSNGGMKMEFIDGCTLPSKSSFKINYSLQCPDNVFQNYCNQSSDGAPVPQSTSLEYKCKEKYYPYVPEASASICFKGAWRPSISQCGRICSPLNPQNVILKCTYEGRDINCDGNLFVNTEVISVSCAPEYRNNGTTNSGSIYCRDNGQWSGPLMKCIPICGRSSRVEITPTIHGGEKVRLGEFPWHAAIYEKPKNNTLICGATIISPYALLSAAHCFYDSVNNQQRSPVDYEIAISKVTRDRFTKDSETTRFHEIETLIFNNFQGRNLRFQRDIVIIVTKTKISFNSQVSPICLFKERHTRIANNATLEVPGWGIDESGSLTGSPILKVVNLPYISFDECIKLAPPSVTSFLVAEKFCTGLNAPTLDQGDSGGGLVLKSSVDFSYYLVGIVSFRATEGNTISLNTYVLDYLPWITSKLTEIHLMKYEIFE